MTTTENGMIVWVDLSTPDVDGAQRFYRELLGWELTSRHTDMGDYVVAETHGREVAGMMAPAPGTAAPPHWAVFVRIDELDTTLETVVEAGGSVHAGPFPIPGGARIAVVADRTGAMLAMISGGPEPEPGYFSEQPGAVCWAELMTSDVGAAADFYHRVFGWSAETDASGPVPYTVYRLDGRETSGMIGRPEHVPDEVPDGWSVYFTVDDCEATVRRAGDLGGSVILPPMPTPAGPFAVLADPAGAAFQIMEIVHDSTADAD